MPSLPGNTSLRATNAAVTNTSAVIVQTNPNRKYLAVINTGTQDVFLNFDAAAVAGGGTGCVPLSAADSTGANGGSFVMEATLVHIGDVRAITATGTSSVTVVEGW